MQESEVPSLASIQSVSQLSSVLQRGFHMHAIEAACCKLRIPLKDLFPKTLGDFAEEGLSPQLQDLRFQHFEKKRTFRLRKVLQALAGGRTSALSNKSQDWGIRRPECSPMGAGRLGTHSVSPQGNEERTVSIADFQDGASTEVSAQDRKKPVHERLLEAQERALKLRLSEMSTRISKLQEKDSRFDRVRDDLRAQGAEKQRKRTLHNLKIRENLEKKYRTLEAYERQEVRKSLQLTPEPKVIHSRGNFRAASKRLLLEDDEDVDRRMELICSRLQQGTERANQRRTLKALSLAAKVDRYRHTRARLEALESSQEREIIEKAVRLKEQQDKSQQLRSDKIAAMVNKRIEIRQLRLSRLSTNSQDFHRGATPDSNQDGSQSRERRPLDPLKAEKASLRRRDVQANRKREKESQQEVRDSILQKHQHLADSAERRNQERASHNQLLLRQEFERQLQRERMRRSVECRIRDVRNQYFRTSEN